MSYGYNNPYQQQYRPYTPAPQVWQTPVQQNWQQPQQTWQPPVEQPPMEPVQPQENPMVLALRDLTNEVSALRKALNTMRKKEEDE